MARRTPPGWRIEPLDPKRDRSGFRCGVESLDRYFASQATQDIRRRVAAVYALIDPEDDIAGYYTLSATHLVPTEIPPDIARKLPRYPRIPATLLGRLAVHETRVGQGLGGVLLVDALLRAFLASDAIGSIGIVVDALDERAEAFYERHGFLRLPGVERRLFLPMKSVELLVGDRSRVAPRKPLSAPALLR